MAIQPTIRPAPVTQFPLSPKWSFLLRRQKHPIGVRGGPHRAPRGYRLDRLEGRRVRRGYALRGRQLARALVAAARQPGDRTENLAGQLEQRLDVLVHRAGFARSVREARELVAHNHFTVDGGKANRPSYRLRPGQTIEVRPIRQTTAPIAVAVAGTASGDVPPYLEVQPDRFAATLVRPPRRQEVPGLHGVALAVHTESSRPEVTG